MRLVFEEDDKSLLDDKPFAGLDARHIGCFGARGVQSKSWATIADQADDVGWKLVDTKQLEKSLAQDVDASYMKVAQATFVNVDDDMPYTCWFDNNKMLWGLAITGSPKAEMSIEERADFFKSDAFKKAAKAIYYKLAAAKEAYDKTVKSHVDNGELLLVDMVKLDAIMDFLDSELFLDNLLQGKYLSY